MSQAEILEFLQERGDWATSKEIAEGIGVAQSVVIPCLRQMERFNFIHVRNHSECSRWYQYKAVEDVS